jgi:hypothetical protein
MAIGVSAKYEVRWDTLGRRFLAAESRYSDREDFSVMYRDRSWPRR